MDSRYAMVSVVTPWWRSKLFWRTFVLLAFLISVSMGAWIFSFRLFASDPQVQQMADQMASVVTITRTALMHSASDSRQELLFDLASHEGIRIYVREPEDSVQPVHSRDGLMRSLEPVLQKRLGKTTRISRQVNGIDGLWISFTIDSEDGYWIVLPKSRIERVSSWQWLWWCMAGFFLSLVGAAFISDLINRPLSRLAVAARTMASGKSPEPLPETGSAEERDACRSFNQMVKDLERSEEERVEVLAGISHDLRTPLTRIQLELEMLSLSEKEKTGMQSDIRQMDAIVGQFLDYARFGVSGKWDTSRAKRVNMSALLHDLADEVSHLPDVHVQAQIQPDIFVHGNETDFKRMLHNLVSNSQRYGQSDDSGKADITISCGQKHDAIIIEISDQGKGISPEDKERLLRPFIRLDSARGQANGSGLGLAIVDRIVKRYNGRLVLGDNTDRGLRVTIVFPLAKAAS
ncbi:MAG: HAMP domain-containing protein [Burkholderiaceae bacterium]|jgi:two-component system osmolarity sensor histidine kinase EnvZ|nr:HAMP domain-containing protein [Burkholderiaceae bacterium]